MCVEKSNLLIVTQTCALTGIQMTVSFVICSFLHLILRSLVDSFILSFVYSSAHHLSIVSNLTTLQIISLCRLSAQTKSTHQRRARISAVSQTVSAVHNVSVAGDYEPSQQAPPSLRRDGRRADRHVSVRLHRGARRTPRQRAATRSLLRHGSAAGCRYWLAEIISLLRHVSVRAHDTCLACVCVKGHF